ncbi:sigma-like protein [Streptomyces sp. G45]|uniref:sigma-like protein n=1 Tax=Streptomyces sp. G45 TaxID=3406627 RepID=UPI003C172A4F
MSEAKKKKIKPMGEGHIPAPPEDGPVATPQGEGHIPAPPKGGITTKGEGHIPAPPKD